MSFFWIEFPSCSRRMNGSTTKKACHRESRSQRLRGRLGIQANNDILMVARAENKWFSSRRIYADAAFIIEREEPLKSIVLQLFRFLHGFLLDSRWARVLNPNNFALNEARKKRLSAVRQKAKQSDQQLCKIAHCYDSKLLFPRPNRKP